MEKETEVLKSILIKGTPILFLGAGFSYGSSNPDGKIPTGKQLTKDIFDHFIKEKVEPDEEKEIENYNLQDICQTVNELLDKKEELKEYLITRFQNVQPETFHYNLIKYPWKKIYTVNIDDLVENIYKKSEEKIIVQNAEKEKEVNDELEYVKLHGCVRAKDDPMVFSKSEYTNLISKKNYKLDKLTADILKNNMIFIGASLDEPDIDYYITQYENAGFLQRGKLVFIDPFPSVKLRTRIKALDGILIKWTTEEFLNFINGLKYNPSEQIRSKKMLNYRGMYCYTDVMDCFEATDVYESKLYQGYGCKWEDIFHNWVIDTKPIVELSEKIDDLKWDTYESYCIAIVGNCFTGKSCILKQIGAYLNKSGYEVIEYTGKYLDQNVLKKYIEVATADRFALLIDNASYYYRIIEKFLQSNFSKKILIITTSRNFYHSKKKYYLENNPYEEYYLEDKIYPKDARKIYNKILEKGYLGELSLDPTEGEKQIIRQKNYINLFSFLTYGKGFKKRIYSMTSAILESSNNVRDLFIELAIFDKADLPYYPGELITNHYAIDYNIFIEKNYSSLKAEQQLIVDNIGIEPNGIILKNRLLIDEIWKKLSSKEKQKIIHNILVNISSYISEDDETYWRIIFESLLKEERLVNQFGLRKKEILSLFYAVKESYKDISYYWLQLGIAEQRVNEFSKALNHLQIAKQIRPNAYQIHHAIARNYLKHAYAEKDIKISLDLFANGEKLILELINSKDPYKEKAKNFSVHCYAYEKIRYLNKHPQFINKKVCENIKKYIDMIIPESDIYTPGLVMQFTQMLSKYHLLSIIRMKPGDIYFQSLSTPKTHLVSLEDDMVIDSY